MKNFIKKYKYIFISGLLGIISFLVIYGFAPLNPTNIDWILVKSGDMGQHYIGWQFFRNSPWTFPIGMNTLGVYPYEISVMYTDSIPFMAIFFKIFSGILPETFQYFGLYGLMCFILHGIIPTIILKKFIKNDYLACFLSLFFIWCPVIIDRMFYHTALVSHYQVFIAIALVLYKDKFSWKKLTIFWSLLGMLSVSTHMYLVVFNGIILIGHLIYDYLTRKDIKRVLIPFIGYIVMTLLAMFIIGGFAFDKSPLGVHSLGLFSFNLNGFFNSCGFSRILPRLKTAKDLVQDEGFAYLGLGLIIASVIALIGSICILCYKKALNKPIKIDKKLLITILIIGFISLIAATAKSIYFGETLLFKYNLPKFLEHYIGVFRSNGRIIWILYYMVIFLAIYGLYNMLQKKAFIVFMVIIFGIQIFDMSETIKNKRLDMTREYNPVLTDERWDKLFSEDFEHVIFPIEFHSSINDMYNVHLYVLKYGKTVNRVSIAQDFLNPVIEKNVEERFKNLNDNEIYIFDPAGFFKVNHVDMNYYILDNLYIGTTRKLDYLEPVEDINVAKFTADDYVKFQFDKEEKYRIKFDGEGVTADDIGFIGVCEISSSGVFITIEDKEKFEVSIYNDKKVNITVTQIVEVIE